jgi:hypothetical protein
LPYSGRVLPAAKSMMKKKNNYIEFYTPGATGFMVGIHEKLFNRSESFLKFKEPGSFKKFKKSADM